MARAAVNYSSAALYSPRPENRVAARSKLPQKKWTGLHLPRNRPRNAWWTRSAWARSCQHVWAASRSYAA